VHIELDESFFNIKRKIQELLSCFLKKTIIIMSIEYIMIY
jgi:hypothetical protein